MPAANPFRALARHRNFRLFWFGQTLSLIGTWMQTMALGWLALQLTNSPFLVGLVASASSWPVVGFSLFSGVLVDRSDKLKLTIWGQVLFLAQAALLWYVVWSGRATIWWLVGLAFATGAINAVEIPARQSLMVELVGREDLREAIALNSSGFNLARIVGPAIGAVAIAQLGIAWCFALNALSYVAVLVGLLMIRLPEWHPTATVASPREGIVEGVRYMRDTRVVAAMLGVVAVYSVLGVPYLTLMPVVARDRLHMGAGGYGMLLACVGVGGLGGALWLAAVGGNWPRGVVWERGTRAYALLLILFGVVHSAALAYPVLLATGFSMIVSGALANSMLQSIVPDELRGRLMAAYSFVVVGLSQAVGSLLAGTIAEHLGEGVAISGTAIAILAYCWWAFRKTPEMRTI
ncbi:MAG: MFS transporter [Gemmatimonadota bacterium]|nr:MFS transporter [Gemmatimonadota bacterium]MDE3172903.1 MFS transporter [Gemmatimonadota bacterium]MDE3214787.1 MFS transporter [Gemmatimonadota bacterium]